MRSNKEKIRTRKNKANKGTLKKVIRYVLVKGPLPYLNW